LQRDVVGGSEELQVAGNKHNQAQPQSLREQLAGSLHESDCLGIHIAICCSGDSLGVSTA
jgi:hypothetical protein